MNRKGDIATTLLVLMTLVLIAASLFVFFQYAGKINVFIGDARFMESAYSREQSVKTILYLGLEDSFVKSYNSVLTNQDFGVVNSKDKGIIIFDNFDETYTNKKMKELIISNFKGWIAKYPGDYNFNSVRDAINAGTYEIDFDGENVSLTLNEYKTIGRLLDNTQERQWIWGVIPTPFTSTKTVFHISVSYQPTIAFSISKDRMGWNSIKEIYDSSAACKLLDVTVCLKDKLKGYSSIVGKQGDYTKIDLESKKMYVLGDKLQVIRFSYLIR